MVDQVAARGQVYSRWGFSQRMNRGLGVSALFAGESGTGKTMAAEVLANDLRLDLYRIDLSGVVSKYIGETEKNLRRVFDAAEESGEVEDEPDWHLLEKGQLDMATYFERMVEKAPRVIGMPIDMDAYGRFWRSTAPI